MNRIAKSALGVALLASATACTQPIIPTDSNNWDSAAAKQIDLQLSEAADRAAEASQTLAQVERSRVAPQEPALDNQAVTEMPSELQRPTSVNWTGPAAGLIGELSRHIGYSYSVVGPEPSVSIMATVTAVDEPAIKVFEDVGYQVAKFAEIFVDPDGKRIEFRYHSDQVAANRAVMPTLSPGNGKSPVVRRAAPRGKDTLGK